MLTCRQMGWHKRHGETQQTAVRRELFIGQRFARICMAEDPLSMDLLQFPRVKKIGRDFSRSFPLDSLILAFDSAAMNL